MGLYLLGFGMALLSAFILNKVLRISSKSYFVVEMPSYKIPLFKNVAINIIEKTKAFVFGAGKIILAISIILWFLGSHGPDATFGNAQNIVSKTVKSTDSNYENKLSEYKLEHSYIGTIGKYIEPSIKPLGYDWKIGIALITSFAAREVFVGTMSTIYSMGGEVDDENATIKNRMRAEINPATGKPMYDAALGFSLLIFYAFAMQCMSTLATTYRETKSWKYPLIQFGYMTALAYLSAFAVYQLLS
jgi:ferrous iron transport protein B